MTPKRIWLAALLVVVSCLLPAVSRAETTFQVSGTESLIALMRQAVETQYQIPAHDVLIIWNDQDLETKLAKLGSGLVATLTDQDLHSLVQRDTLMLKVMDGTRYKGSVPVHVKVDGWLEVFQARQMIPKGEALSALNVTSQRIKLSVLPGQVLRPPFRLEDFLTRQEIPANTILRSALLQERPLVQRGDEIKVILIQGSLRLVATGEALDTGPRNSLIRVKVTNFGTNKMIRARVTGEGEVTLEIEA